MKYHGFLLSMYFCKRKLFHDNTGFLSQIFRITKPYSSLKITVSSNAHNRIKRDVTLQKQFWLFVKWTFNLTVGGLGVALSVRVVTLCGYGSTFVRTYIHTYIHTYLSATQTAGDTLTVARAKLLHFLGSTSLRNTSLCLLNT